MKILDRWRCRRGRHDWLAQVCYGIAEDKRGNPYSAPGTVPCCSRCYQCDWPRFRKFDLPCNEGVARVKAGQP